jgi:hypothetical protein
MRIGKDGEDWIRLGLAGYQFPDAEDVRKRCSWHIVEGKASCPDGAWDFRWQALACDESVRLIDWFRMAADWLEPDAPTPGWVPAGTDFTEANLSFSVNRDRDGGGLMIVMMNMEFRPPWRAPSRTVDTPTVLHIPVSPTEVRRAAGEWAAELAKYPDDTRWSPS